MILKKSLHSLRNQNQTFQNFQVTGFEITYLINGKSFLHNLKSDSWALVSAIKGQNMTRLQLLQTHGNFHQSNKYVNGQEGKNPTFVLPFYILTGSSHICFGDFTYVGIRTINRNGRGRVCLCQDNNKELSFPVWNQDK